MKPLLVDFSFLTAPGFWCGLCLGIGFWLGAKWGRLREAKRIFSSRRYASRREAQVRRKKNPVDQLLGSEPVGGLTGSAVCRSVPQRWRQIGGQG